MIYNLFTDPHLGTKRAAHTTRDSAERLKSMLYTNALVASEPMNSICLGDLFDKAYNDESTLIQGYTVAHRCLQTLSGNHDETNRVGAITSLQALKQMGAPIVSCPDLFTPYFENFEEFWIVPHHASQEVFDEALRDAADLRSDTQDYADGKHAYLLLHCNYDCPFDTEDSTLNLSPELAEELLETFTRVFIGHDHNPKMLMNDRVVVMGNTHPSSFSDVSNKYRYVLDVSTDELTKVLIWSETDNYREVEFGSPIPDLAGVQFVDVVGSEAVDNAVDVADYVRSIWDASGRLLAVRNNVMVIDHLAAEGADSQAPALVDLSRRIESDLEGSDLQGYYKHLLSRAESL